MPKAKKKTYVDPSIAALQEASNKQEKRCNEAYKFAKEQFLRTSYPEEVIDSVDSFVEAEAIVNCLMVNFPTLNVTFDYDPRRPKGGKIEFHVDPKTADQLELVYSNTKYFSQANVVRCENGQLYPSTNDVEQFAKGLIFGLRTNRHG